jgi:hypothetical protein
MPFSYCSSIWELLSSLVTFRWSWKVISKCPASTDMGTLLSCCCDIYYKLHVELSCQLNWFCCHSIQKIKHMVVTSTLFFIMRWVAVPCLVDASPLFLTVEGQHLLDCNLLDYNVLGYESMMTGNPPPMPPRVAYGLRGFPSRWWLKCNKLLRLGHPWGTVTLSQWGGWWCMNLKYQEGP